MPIKSIRTTVQVSFFREQLNDTVREIFSPITQGKKKIADVVARLSFRDQPTQFLIHIESQSSAYSNDDFPKRVFHYFSRLQEKYDLPVYPIALFTFDKPFATQENQYIIRFPDRQVLEFNFATIQLNRLNWRDFLEKKNPVASALMTKMGVVAEDRARVKSECLRLLATLKLDPKKIRFISGFISTYLPLNELEEQEFQQILESIGLKTKETVMELMSEWERKGLEKGLQQGLQRDQNNILRILEVKFQDISPQIREDIEKVKDIEILSNLVVRAATTPSINEFEVVLNQSIPQKDSESDRTSQ